MRSRHLLVLLGVLLVAALAVSTVAFGAKQVKGGKYSGHLTSSSKTTVSFKVSASGRKITRLKIKPSVPSKCSSGGRGSPPAVSAKIKRGKFKAKIKVTVAGTKRTVAQVTGKFLSHRKERGKIKSFGRTASCTASYRYSAKAK